MPNLRARHAAAVAISIAIVLAGCGDGGTKSNARADDHGHDHSHDGHDHSHDGHDHAHDDHGHDPKYSFVPRPPSDGAVDVVPTNYPLAYMADRIGGDSVRIHFIVPQDGDPAFWKPQADDVKQLQDADILLFNGATYEKWASTVTLAETRIVDTSVAFADRYIVVEDAETHSHGPGEEHSHAGIAFTTWLDPMLAVEQAKAIADAFSAQQPQKAPEYAERFAELKTELEALDKRLAELTAPLRNQPLVASHPVYEYFARRYALDLRSVSWEPGTDPSAEQWVKFSEILAEHPAKLMLWEGEPSDETRQKLADEGVEWIVFAPTMNVPEKGDFIANMHANADNLEAAIK